MGTKRLRGGGGGTYITWRDANHGGIECHNQGGGGSDEGETSGNANKYQAHDTMHFMAGVGW